VELVARGAVSLQDAEDKVPDPGGDAVSRVLTAVDGKACQIS